MPSPMWSPTRSVSMLPGSCQHHISALHRMKISRVWSCLVPTTPQLAAPTELCSGHDQEEFFPRLHYSSSQQTFSQAVAAWDCCSHWQLASKHGTAGPAFQPYGFHGDMHLENKCPSSCWLWRAKQASLDQDEQESLCAMFTALLLSDKTPNLPELAMILREMKGCTCFKKVLQALSLYIKGQ